MTHFPQLIVGAVVLAAVCACEPEPVEKTVWDDQIQTLDKAREVEDELAKRAGQLAEDLDYNANPDEEKDKENR